MVRLNERAGIGFGDADELDDLDIDLASRLEDPEFAASFEDAAARSGLLRSCLGMRHQRGFTQQAVADRMETTQSAVSELEGGATDPRLSTLQRYARAIDCRLDVQLCEGSHGSGWRRLGVDVHYSSHEDHLEPLVDLWRWEPQGGAWNRSRLVTVPTSVGDNPEAEAAAG